ncbi:MAG TPA: hypothetical protein VFT12_12160, partial [Thermoanaerobaculia bacterium]|nr:hypothetical protein [Thermoanaerobaculia bacterium]
MRLTRIVSASGALLLLFAAASIGIRFRAMPPPTDLRAMTWDAASHALIGLDVFDHVRRLEPLLLLLRLQAEHWWPPLFGILSLPAWAIGGRELTSPSLVSLASYCLIPLFAWLAVRRIATAIPLVPLGLVAIFLLRSPQLIEMSTWSMLELAAALFAGAALYCFLAGPESRARNWAYGLAGASTLLKYHYGFFLLVTFGVATLAELDPAQRRAFALQLKIWLRRRAVWIPGAVLIAAVTVRLIEERIDPDPSMPGVPTLVWIAYILTLITLLVKRALARSVWAVIPSLLQRYIRYGLIWPMVWLVDLANAQAWYRELRVRSDPPALWIDQLRELRRYLTDDYFLSPIVMTVAAIGLALCIIEGVRRRSIPLLAVALHGVWPVALMTLSKFRIESRFLSTFMVALVISAALGWTLTLARRATFLRIALGVILLAVIAGDVSSRQDEWEAHLARRRVYGYLSSDPPDRFVRATIEQFKAGLPVLILLPDDIDVVSPTIRLGLRLALPNVRPDRIEVRGGSIRRFEQRLRKFRGGLVGVETDPATLHRIAEAN